jgi:hypothetical protein
MGIEIDEIGKQLHAKLDSGIDRLKTAKTNIEALAQETEDTLKEKLNAAKTAMAAKKQEAASAMDKMEAYVKDKAEDTEAAVAEWKVNRDRKKLEKRAERAERYANSCVELAVYYAGEAQVAILEAAAARQDADDAA